MKNKRNISGAICMAVFALALILVGCPSPPTDNKGSSAPTKEPLGLSLNTMEGTLTLSFDKNIKSVKDKGKIIVYKKSTGTTTDAPPEIEQDTFTATAVDGKLVITLVDAITAGDIFYVELQALAVTDEDDVANTDTITSKEITIPNVFVEAFAIDKTAKTLTLNFNASLVAKEGSKIAVYKGDTVLEPSAYTIGAIDPSDDKTLVITLTDAIGVSDTFTVKFQAGALTVDDALNEALEISIDASGEVSVNPIDTGSPAFAHPTDALSLDITSKTLTVSFNKRIASKTNANIKVLKTPNGGVETTLEITTHYTIAIDGAKVVITLKAWNEGDAYKVQFLADAVKGTNDIGNAEITTEVAIKIETFTITANDIRVLINTAVNSSITKNAAITGAFGISPALTGGTLSLDTATGTITGQSAVYVAPVAYTVTFIGSGAYTAIRATTPLTIGIYKYQPTTRAALKANIATEIAAQGGIATADLNNIDTSAITNMQSIFAIKATFNGDISKWNTGNVTDMQQMFQGATAFDGDISGWNVRKVTNMENMFYQADAFNQDLSGWNVRKVTNMSWMFRKATAFNQDISGWNVGNVTTMEYMFWLATAFDQDISRWNVSKVSTMEGMFYQAAAFNQDLSGWNVQSSVNRAWMFKGSGVTTNPSWCSGGRQPC